MKLEEPKNSNYAAVVIKIKTLIPLVNCDNLLGTPMLGFQAIVSRSAEEGELGVVFPAETQLSEEFCRKNNLFRHNNMNEDESQKGYIEDNRRIRAMKLRGHRSDCLFLSLNCLKYTHAKIGELKEGDVFDQINGHDICQKYIVKVKHSVNRLEKNKLKFVRIDTKYLPEHYDSENYFRNVDVIPQEKIVTVSQKLHGTSIRVANTIVQRKLNLAEKVLHRLGFKIQHYEYDYVYGSRKVIKDINNPHQNHFYGTDLWTEEGEKLKGLLPEGYILYGEVVGWVDEATPIQKNYTYSLAPGMRQLYVYRIAHINPQGRVVDLTWEQLKEFCRDNGLQPVPELWIGPHRDFKAEEWLDRCFANDYALALSLEPIPELVDEGVCIRADGLTPYILKAKSPIFLQHESKMLDQEALDVEASESLVDEIAIA